MAWEKCADCRYCEYKPVGEFHFGTHKDSVDYYCSYHDKWLNGDVSGHCSAFEEK